jgi:MoxR-like ATPase
MIVVFAPPTAVAATGDARATPAHDVLDACRRLSESTGQPLQVATTFDELVAALSPGTGRARPSHVVIDRRWRDAATADDMGELLRSPLVADVPTSVFYDVISDVEVSEIFTNPHLDQAIELRTAVDLSTAMATIEEHLRTADEGVPEGSTRVGSLFQVEAGDYANARRRSLVSGKLGGFVADLRQVFLAMAQFPLQERPPFDPRDEQPTLLHTAKDGSASLDLRRGGVPNLADLFAAHDSDDSRDLLKARDPRSLEDDVWSRAWRDPHPPALLITGESGTGKTLVARVIGDLLLDRQVSDHPAKGRFIKINGAGLLPENFTHDVFGAAPGQWTGIERPVPGELAQGAHGIAFFDEIGDLDPAVQRALLTFLDDRLIRPKGIAPFPGFQHIIAATNRDVREGALQRWFRNDLLERFTLHLEIPPLRLRGQDEIRQLVDFLAQDPAENPLVEGRHLVSHIAPEAMDDLAGRQYRNGNFRELARTVHEGMRTARRRRSRVVRRADLPLPEPLHVRSDTESARIGARSLHLPDTFAVVEVAEPDDLRIIAHARATKVAHDEAGNQWVLSDAVCFRWTLPLEH